MTTARRAAREARGAWGASRRRAGDERVRRVRAPTSARHARRPGAGLLARCGATTRDRPLLDGSSERPGFQKPRADVSSAASFLRLDAPVAATPFAASAPLFRACFGTSWGVRRELRGGNTRALPRVRASERSDDKKKNRGCSRGARLAHQLSSRADLAKNDEREPNEREQQSGSREKRVFKIISPWIHVQQTVEIRSRANHGVRVRFHARAFSAARLARSSEAERWSPLRRAEATPTERPREGRLRRSRTRGSWRLRSRRRLSRRRRARSRANPAPAKRSSRPTSGRGRAARRALPRRARRSARAPALEPRRTSSARALREVWSGTTRRTERRTTTTPPNARRPDMLRTTTLRMANEERTRKRVFCWKRRNPRRVTTTTTKRETRLNVLDRLPTRTGWTMIGSGVRRVSSGSTPSRPSARRRTRSTRRTRRIF